MPAFLWMLDNNSDGVLGVLAHEVGHQIGPEMSVINGHDLRGIHLSTLQCLSQPDSIYMQKNQADESIADMIAAEVLAQIANRTDTLEEKINLIQSGVQSYCVMDMLEQREFGSRTRGNVHPNPLLRVGGLFGGNASIRNTLGCNNESKSYKTCGW